MPTETLLGKVGSDTNIIMGIKGPSKRTLLLFTAQGTLMNITLLKHFMWAERKNYSTKEVADG